jgi:hypothetical protein
VEEILKGQGDISLNLEERESTCLLLSCCCKGIRSS